MSGLVRVVTDRMGPHGRCGFILDRTETGPHCAKPASYLVYFRDGDWPGLACAEHAQVARQMPELVKMRVWRGGVST